MLLTHRHKLWELVPEWLKGFNAFRLLYAIAVVIDALYEMLIAAIKIRFPNLYSSESLTLLSAERRKRRGPNESAESFAARLNKWWDTAKHSGDLFTIAREMSAYFLPAVVPITIITNNGTRYTLTTDGAWEIDSVSWDWDGHSEMWSRFWVLISNEYIEATGTDHTVLRTGSDVLQPGRFIGSDATDSARALRAILEDHRAPHTYCDAIIIVLDETAFWASPPDGDWDYWKNRNLNALYWAGTQ